MENQGWTYHGPTNPKSEKSDCDPPPPPPQPDVTPAVPPTNTPHPSHLTRYRLPDSLTPSSSSSSASSLPLSSSSPSVSSGQFLSGLMESMVCGQYRTDRTPMDVPTIFDETMHDKSAPNFNNNSNGNNNNNSNNNNNNARPFSYHQQPTRNRAYEGLYINHETMYGPLSYSPPIAYNYDQNTWTTKYAGSGYSGFCASTTSTSNLLAAVQQPTSVTSSLQTPFLSPADGTLQPPGGKTSYTFA